MKRTPDTLPYNWFRGTLTYASALLFIALLAFCSHWLVQSIVNQQESTARIINLAGRQRMLSQRITLFASELVNHSNRDSQLAGEYQHAIEQMTIAHDALLNGSQQLNIPAPSSGKIKAIFTQPPDLLDYKVTHFLNLATSLIQDHRDKASQVEIFEKLRGASYHEILNSLEHLVTQYQRESEQNIRKLERYNLYSLLALIITLLLEAFVIFRPLLTSLFQREQQYINLLNQQKGDIAEYIQFQIFNDTLTKLPNRIAMLEKIATCIQLAKHNQTNLIVIAISMNRFSRINETFGHETGDNVLIEQAERLKRFVEQYSGFVGRLVADEFVIAMDHSIHQSDIQPLLKALSQTISTPIHLENQLIQISAAFGLACYPSDGEAPYELLHHANQAMNTAKKEGGENFRMFTPLMTSQISRRSYLEDQLHQALIEDDQLRLVYQPKVDLQTFQLTGVEALLRWDHPEQGPISPGEFIPIAEGTGLINSVGDWVIAHVFRQIAKWQEQKLFINVAVNISVKQLMQEHISHKIVALANQLNIRPSQIQIEVTEDNMMENLTHIRKELLLLEHFGFDIAIDDFGTGHSSLARLRNLPVRYLKVDQAFVANLPHDQRDSQLVSAIIDMGHSLNKVIIAEGVETTEQMELLQMFGCEQAQGYLFSKPLPPQDFIEFSRNYRYQNNKSILT